MWLPVIDIGRYGIIQDIAPHALPLGAWSNGQNVRYRNGRVFRTRGSMSVYQNPAANPYWGINIDAGDNNYWLYATLSDLYSGLPNTCLLYTSPSP